MNFNHFELTEGNQISNLEPKTFDGNNRLEKLVLSKNNIPLLEVRFYD